MRIDSFRIQWRASQIIEKEQDAWLSPVRYKDDTEDLFNFIKESNQQGHYLTMNYFINGFDFVQYMNLNYFRRSTLDTPGQLVNSLSFPWNANKQINYPYEKILWKRHLGQTISKQEVEEAVDRMKYSSGEQRQNLIEKVYQEEQQDVNLYGCCICRDRECGYYNIAVVDNGQFIEWDLKIPYHRRYCFDRQAYYDAFAEYGELLEKKKDEE